MNIELHKITVRALTEGYEDDVDTGVRAYGGLLDVRPPYQREFVYDDKKRNAVIATATRDFPLNVMYWAKRPDGTFEVIDGQQRTISLCRYLESSFSVPRDGHPRAFANLKDDQQQQLLDYELMVYICTGTESEKLDWFRTINIAGERLFEQELRNAVYAGPWLSHARPYFSKTSCAAYQLGQDYMSGTPNRQDYLETALDWISRGQVEEYMSRHQFDANSNELRRYFQDVIAWVAATFPTKRKAVMRGVEWGHLYNKFKDTALDPAKLEAAVARLLLDEEVQKQGGIYAYVLDGDERWLNLRGFTDNQKQRAFERQKGVCPVCKEKFELHQMEGDHIDPWHEGGKTIDSNLQMLCKQDNRRKGGK